MDDYLANRWIRIALWLMAIGWGPLLGVLLLAALHLWPDPNPNPIGLGLLFAVTFWPVANCGCAGAFQVRRGRN